MKTAKFTLDHLFFPELSVKANQDYDPEATEQPTEPDVVIHMQRTGPNIFHVGVNLTLTAEVESDKYEIKTLGVGVFSGDETLQDDQRVALIAQSGPNIVYSGIRDMIATVTGRGPWNEYYLQPKIIGPEDFKVHPAGD